MATHTFTGSITALITPFRHGEIDEEALRGLVDFQIRSGTSGLVPCGTTGESVTMSDEEQDRVIRIVVEQAAGRIPVIAGTGTNDTARTVQRTARARELGADAALIVTPYYNKPTQAGLYHHYATVAETVDLPIILYNVPGRTAVNLLPETVARLAAVPNIVGIKEASGSLDQCSQIRLEAGPEFILLSGDDSLTLPIMSIGGQGIISVVANIAPAPVAELTAAMLAGDLETARNVHADLFDLCRAMFLDNNPIAVKTAAGILGLCSAEVRLPQTPMSEANRRVLEATLQRCRFTRMVVAA